MILAYMVLVAIMIATGCLLAGLGQGTYLSQEVSVPRSFLLANVCLIFSQWLRILLVLSGALFVYPYLLRWRFHEDAEKGP